MKIARKTKVLKAIVLPTFANMEVIPEPYINIIYASLDVASIRVDSASFSMCSEVILSQVQKLSNQQASQAETLVG